MARRIVILVLLVVLLAVLYWVSREHVSLDALVARESRLREALDRHPWRGFGIAFVAYVIVSLVPGTTGKALVAAWLLGFWRGLFVVNVGLTVAALVSFSVSRWLCRDLVKRRLGRRLRRVNVALRREGAGYLFAARVLHTPYALTNYVMGATRIRMRSFWWATQLGLLPGNLVFVYAGAQVPTLEELMERGIMSLLSPGLIIAFVVLSVLPLVLRRLVRRLLERIRARSAAAHV